MAKTAAAIIGSGNIGTDLLEKMRRRSDILQPAVLVGIDPDSDGLARAKQYGIRATHRGIEGLFEDEGFEDIGVVFDATSAKAHLHHAPLLKARGKKVVDLTPAAVGPYVVPVANLEEGLGHDNVNMVTCGGQATIPMVKAMSAVGPVHYAEIVASIASRSAGPGTRANIDEFTVTTARGLEQVGGAKKGKAIIVLNPAEPPLIMRDTVYGLVESRDEDALAKSIKSMVEQVAAYVPGYRLVQEPVFEEVAQRFDDGTVHHGTKVSVFLEVEGAGDYLPAYAGNLDIMTSAALKMGEEIAQEAAR